MRSNWITFSVLDFATQLTLFVCHSKSLSSKFCMKSMDIDCKLSRKLHWDLQSTVSLSVIESVKVSIFCLSARTKYQRITGSVYVRRHENKQMCRGDEILDKNAKIQIHPVQYSIQIHTMDWRETCPAHRDRHPTIILILASLSSLEWWLVRLEEQSQYCLLTSRPTREIQSFGIGEVHGISKLWSVIPSSSVSASSETYYWWSGWLLLPGPVSEKKKEVSNVLKIPSWRCWFGVFDFIFKFDVLKGLYYE